MTETVLLSSKEVLERSSFSCFCCTKNLNKLSEGTRFADGGKVLAKITYFAAWDESQGRYMPSAAAERRA